MVTNGNPDLSIAVEKLRLDIESLKRQVRGVPEERRKGIQDTIEKMEAEYIHLEAELERERQTRRTDLQTLRENAKELEVNLREIIKEVQVNLMMAEVKVRWAMWGLSGFGLLATVLGAVVYILFNRLAGGAP